ncbi:bZIP transcription factor NDAI_0B01800 [Naumovozyma dairenensis CBS 421]|uniref:BZIP domain-containing protein n=1 Tax=Naumovozyma dairenensis (strain ATCC 10597 / BCRC 20456 / CBS 421 / NBRC 0211 / NRRL Y-12639) TaxID=1071378 RepID=G0W603_NAUDC|nr:hypothetical protein NDAI_0B01800 [Naumovozyma dairenensis CBS 421]CCD23214.1 hypothetical protein NDAI_0B01800 [Naumovozyma dairenensis CBS 421]
MNYNQQPISPQELLNMFQHRNMIPESQYMASQGYYPNQYQNDPRTDDNNNSMPPASSDVPPPPAAVASATPTFLDPMGFNNECPLLNNSPVQTVLPQQQQLQHRSSSPSLMNPYSSIPLTKENNNNQQYQVPHNHQVQNNINSFKDALPSPRSKKNSLNSSNTINPNYNIIDNNNNNTLDLTEEEIKAKKKAQNRAAQKAFRERKDAKLKELREKLNESEQNRQDLLKEVDSLRKLNMEINAESKKILLQTTNNIDNIKKLLIEEAQSAPSSSSSVNNVIIKKNSSDESLNDHQFLLSGANNPMEKHYHHRTSSSSSPHLQNDSKFSFPTEDQNFNIIDDLQDKLYSYASAYTDNSTNNNNSNDINSLASPNTMDSNTSTGTLAPREPLLTIPATWEYLHKLSEHQDFDVFVVMQMLKGKEACDEYGPAYPKALVNEMVEKCINEN